MSSQLLEHSLLPGTFAAELSGDVTAAFIGSAHASVNENGGSTVELQAATSSEVILISVTGGIGPGQYRVWGDDCEGGGAGPQDGEIVFHINAQGGVPQWTLSAYDGLLLIATNDNGVLIGRFEARTCAERLGSRAELAVTLRGFFNARFSR